MAQACSKLVTMIDTFLSDVEMLDACLSDVEMLDACLSMLPSEPSL
jgi:hypothetical protein